MSFRRLRHRGSHDIFLVRTLSRPARHVIVKVPRRGRTTESRREALRKRAETEYHVLTEIAPRISAGNPSTRCPQALGFDPDAALLVLERVDGDNLKSLLFGLGRAPQRDKVARVLRLAAEWLARLHGVTPSEGERNPFDWVLAELEFPAVRQTLRAYAGDAAYRELARYATRFRSAYPDLRRPLCRIHGAFVPNHVLVDADGICVIDLETSRLGFPYEDLALFTACCELFVPWRQLIGRGRMTSAELTALFWRAYTEQTGLPSGPELILRRFTRLIGMARFVSLCLYGQCGEDMLAAAGSFAGEAPAVFPPSEVRRRSLKTRLLAPWWRYRFHVVSRQEIEALRKA